MMPDQVTKGHLPSLWKTQSWFKAFVEFVPAGKGQIIVFVLYFGRLKYTECKWLCQWHNMAQRTNFIPIKLSKHWLTECVVYMKIIAFLNKSHSRISRFLVEVKLFRSRSSWPFRLQLFVRTVPCAPGITGDYRDCRWSALSSALADGWTHLQSQFSTAWLG